MQLQKRQLQAKEKLEKIKQPAYLQSLVGTLGADPLGPYLTLRG
jgi:hypothetical protein